MSSVTVGVYLPDENEEHTKVLTAFAEGLKKLGVDCVVTNIKNYCSTNAPDVAVVFGVYKKVVKDAWWRGRVILGQQHMGKDVLILEKGYIKRDEYYSAGWNGLNNRASFINDDMPSDRFDALGVELKERTPGDYILVCGQVPWDASVAETDHLKWINDVIVDMGQITNRTIMLRPHPKAADYTPLVLGAEYQNEGPIEKVIENAFAVVTFNSNSGVDAVLAGKPVYAFDEGSMVFNIANHSLVDINDPFMPIRPIRQRWANNIAYAQWNLQEMAEGLPWLHLTREAENKEVG